MVDIAVHLRKLQRIRLRKAISQTALAKKASVSRQTIIRAESGGTTAFANAHKIADALGVSVEDLQGEEEDDRAVA